MSAFQFQADISRFVHTTTRYSGENALVLTDCARLAYEDESVVKARLRGGWNFDRVDCFSGGSTQAFVGGNDRYLIIAFRGTEPTNIRDWFRDLDAHFTAGPAGRVHRGFLKALDEVWDGADGLRSRIFEFRDQQQTLWLAGHSLGGALAVLATARLRLVEKLPLNGIYTIGQPRVGDSAFVQALSDGVSDRHFRFVNNNDIVTRVPAWLYGYRHGGNRLYFDNQGTLLDSISWWRELIDGVLGVSGSVGDLGVDAIEDHSKDEYGRLVEKNRSVTTRWS